jgi:hypothetical protein
MWFLPKQWFALTWCFCRFTWLKMGQLQGSAGRWQTEVLCLLVFGGSQSSQILASLFLQFSALHYCWQGCRHSKAERDLLRWQAIRGSVSTHIMVDPGIPRCFQVYFCSSLCCVLALPTQTQRIKRERTGKKQWAWTISPCPQLFTASWQTGVLAATTWPSVL